MAKKEIIVAKPFKFMFDKNFNLQDYTHVVFHGGRGGGKTKAIARYLVYLAVNQPLKILCARQFQNSIEDSVKDEIEEAIADMDLDDYFEIEAKKIYSKCGAEFSFRGLSRNIHSIKGMTADITWVEEASAIEEKPFKFLTRTVIRKGSHWKAGKMIWTFNPESVYDPVYKRFIKDPDKPEYDPKLDPAILVREVNYYDNDLNDPQFIKEAQDTKALDPVDYAYSFLGQAAVTGADIVFAKENWEEVRDPKDFWEKNKELFGIPYVGLDYGMSPDPLAVICVYVSPDQTTIYVHDELCSTNVKDIGRFLNQMDAIRLDHAQITADTSENRSTINLRDAGFNIRKAKKGQDSIHEGIKWLKRRHIFVHPKCKQLIKELHAYRYKRDTKDPTIIIADKYLEHQSDHCIDALRYALEGIMLNTKTAGRYRGVNLGI